MSRNLFIELSPDLPHGALSPRLLLSASLSCLVPCILLIPCISPRLCPSLPRRVLPPCLRASMLPSPRRAVPPSLPHCAAAPSLAPECPIDDHQIITNGKYKSCMHRAITNPDRARLLVATFHDPAKTVRISPASELINESSPAKYRGVVYGDYVKKITVHTMKDMVEKLEKARSGKSEV
ncbi:hypothetical protein HN51_071593 [Arachis hypogaea]